MTNVRRLSFLCLMTLLAGCVIPTSQYSRVVTQEIETTPLLEIDVSTFNGPISVESHPEAYVIIETTYKAYGTTESDAQIACEQLDTEVIANDGRLVLKATKPTTMLNASIGYQLKVPANCALQLKTSNGRISVTGINSKVSVETSNGTVAFREVHDDMVARTSNGTITVEQSSGSIDLKTSNGKINASGRFRGRENKIRTSNGSVTLSLPADQTAEVSARTSNGKISCSLTMQNIVKQGKHDLHAIVGSGESDQPASQFTIETSNGSVKIMPMDASSQPAPESSREA